MESNTPQDAKSLVFDGRAGTGAAYVLKDAFQKGLDLQRHYDDQDAQRAQQDKLLAHRDKQAAEKAAHQDQLAQDKQADARLDAFAKFDPSGIMPEDAQRIVERHQAMLRQTQADIAAGRNPGNRTNAAEYTRMMSTSAANQAEAEKSKQYNTERIKQAQTIQGAGIDNPYNTAANVAAWDAFVQASPEQRLQMGTPKLSHYVDLMKVTRIVGGDVQKALRTTTTSKEERTSVGSGVRTTTTKALDPQFVENTAQGLRNYPGVDEKLQDEYRALPPSEKKQYLNYDQFAEARATEYARSLAAGGTESTLTLNRAPQPRVENQHYAQERTDQHQSATNLLTKYNQLRTGGAEQYGQPVVIGGKSYLRSDEFNNYTVGDYNGKPNQVRGVLRDEAGKMYLATDASNGRPVEMTDQDAFNKFLLPAWTGSNMKGKAEVLQAAARRFFVPGTNTLDTHALGNAGTVEGEASARGALHANKRYVQVLHEELANTALAIDPASTDTAEYRGKRLSKAQVGASTLTTILKRGRLEYEGSTMHNPVVSVVGTGAKAHLELSYEKVVDKKGTTQAATLKVTPARLAELMKGFVPKEDHLKKPVTDARANAAPGTAPTVTAQQAATTVTTKTSSGKRDLLNLGVSPVNPKLTKRNSLGL